MNNAYWFITSLNIKPKQNQKMKKLAFKVTLFAGVFALASCAPRGDRTSEMMERLELGEIPEEVDVFNIQTGQSEVAWLGQTIVGRSHDGTIGIQSGELYVYNGTLLGGRVDIDMNQIVVLDIEDPDLNARLRGHLMNDDFFAVDQYPVSTLEIASFEPIEGAAAGGPNYRVTGNLTIRGITHGIAFDAFVDQNESRIHATADFAFDRSLYNVRFRSGRFFEDLGENLIIDDIGLGVNLIAEL